VPYLSRFYRVVRPDLRGLGQSAVPADLEKDLSPEAYVEDLVALIDALGGEPVHYCGESLGGILGMVLAAQHPSRLRTLSLVAAPVLINRDTQKAFAFDHPTWQDALRAMGSRGWADAANAATRFPADTDSGLLGWYADEMGKSRVEVLIRMSRIASAIDATPLLSRITTPTLGLYPAQAPVTIQTQEQTIRNGIPHIRIVHVPSRHHTIQNLMPALLARHVLYFAAQVDGIACEER
jgi:3-oxoadipate enol-lactonase